MKINTFAIFGDFAYNPDAISEEDVQFYHANAAARALGKSESLWLRSRRWPTNERTTRNKLTVPMLAWGGRILW